MATRQKKGKMIALWVLRVVVGLAFLAAGGSKLAGAPAMVAMFAKIGFGQWFRILTGLLEVTAAIGLFIPSYTLYAAATLAVVMARLLASISQSWAETPSHRLFFFFSQALSLG
jgi:uncharacterized membrane protein YphA (DoxX/SURF4 family)